jgi:hypothetical protein
MVSTKDEVFYPKTQVVLDHHKHKKKKRSPHPFAGIITSGSYF